MRSLIAIGLVLTLVACADNPPSRAYLALSDRLDTGTLRSRYHSILDADEFAPLRGHVDLSETFDRGGLPPCENTRLDGYPTPTESGALRSWIALRTAYFTRVDLLQTRAAETSSEAAPAARRYETALSDALQLSTAAISDLADGKITYCQFARRDKVLAYSAKGQALPLRDDMEAAMTGFGPGELSMYGALGATGIANGHP